MQPPSTNPIVTVTLKSPAGLPRAGEPRRSSAHPEPAEAWGDARWVKGKSLAAFLDVSRDTIERRAVPWQESPVPHRFRFKLLQLDATTPPERRYFLRDAEQCLQDPAPNFRPST